MKHVLSTLSKVTKSSVEVIVPKAAANVATDKVIIKNDNKEADEIEKPLYLNQFEEFRL